LLLRSDWGIGAVEAYRELPTWECELLLEVSESRRKDEPLNSRPPKVTDADMGDEPPSWLDRLPT
jgi:hypothetical protein